MKRGGGFAFSKMNLCLLVKFEGLPPGGRLIDKNLSLCCDVLFPFISAFIRKVNSSEMLFSETVEKGEDLWYNNAEL